MPPSATLFDAYGHALPIGTGCQSTQGFSATSAQTTQSLLFLFNQKGCPVGSLVPCGVVYTAGAQNDLGPLAGQVVSARRHNLPDNFP
jgi:hypothetical protein